jgi:hypothetical protein
MQGRVIVLQRSMAKGGSEVLVRSRGRVGAMENGETGANKIEVIGFWSSVAISPPMPATDNRRLITDN